MEYLQYGAVGHVLKTVGFDVLNLIINGIPSILMDFQYTMDAYEF